MPEKITAIAVPPGQAQWIVERMIAEPDTVAWLAYDTLIGWADAQKRFDADMTTFRGMLGGLDKQFTQFEERLAGRIEGQRPYTGCVRRNLRERAGWTDRRAGRIPESRAVTSSSLEVK